MRKLPLGWVFTAAIAVLLPTFTIIFASGRQAEKIDRPPQPLTNMLIFPAA